MMRTVHRNVLYIHKALENLDTNNVELSPNELIKRLLGGN